MSKKEKTFKLPKEFAEKWIKALRSGKYQQGRNLLAKIVHTNQKEIIVKYCCLGVGLSICGVEDLLIEGLTLPDSLSSKPKGFPIELYTENYIEDNNLISILTRLNDSTLEEEFTLIKNTHRNIIFRKSFHKIPEKKVYYTFSEIADWIEDNIEFIENENKPK